MLGEWFDSCDCDSQRVCVPFDIYGYRQSLCSHLGLLHYCHLPVDVGSVICTDMLTLVSCWLECTRKHAFDCSVALQPVSDKLIVYQIVI